MLIDSCPQKTQIHPFFDICQWPLPKSLSPETAPVNPRTIVNHFVQKVTQLPIRLELARLIPHVVHAVLVIRLELLHMIEAIGLVRGRRRDEAKEEEDSEAVRDTKHLTRFYFRRILQFSAFNYFSRRRVISGFFSFLREEGWRLEKCSDNWISQGVFSGAERGKESFVRAICLFWTNGFPLWESPMKLSVASVENDSVLFYSGKTTCDAQE